MLRRTRVPMLLAAAGLLLAACGEGDPAADMTEEVAAAEEAPAEEDPPAEEEASAGEAAAAEEEASAEDGDLDLAVGSTDLGEVLVDGDGMTLYLFTQDPPGESVCEGDCADAWPPLIVDDDPRIGDGVDAALVRTITRADGTMQVTYDDAPLYNWAADQQPGDVTGQGVNDVWFVVLPDGSAVMDDDGDDEESPGGTDY
jgi:predicted lipoprotein with Yx(FWY)xxD motif